MAGDEPRSVFDLESFPSFTSHHPYSSSPQRKIELKQWSMVVIRDSLPNGDFSVFPPSNHENLQPPSAEQDERASPASLLSNSPPSSFRSSQSSSSFSSLSFSDDETSRPQSPKKPADCRIRQSVAVSRWMAVGVQILRSRIASMASSIWSNAGRRTAFWLLVTLWWLYKRARQRRMRPTTERLKMMIRDKDEKINQLLQQVAQLNRSLLAQQKVLPSN